MVLLAHLPPAAGYFAGSDFQNSPRPGDLERGDRLVAFGSLRAVDNVDGRVRYRRRDRVG